MEEAKNRLSEFEDIDVSFLDCVSAEAVSTLDDLQTLVDNTDHTCSHLIQRANLIKAHQCRNKLKSILNEIVQRNDKLSGAAQHALQDSDVYIELERRIQVTNTLRKMMFQSDDWAVISDSAGVKIQYEQAQGQSLYNFKITTTVKAPLFNILAVIYEVDLYQKWMPLLKKCEQLAILDTFQKIAHVEVHSVWPVANRDAVCEGFGVDFEEDGAVLVILQSVHEHAKFKVPPPPPSVVRSDVKIGGFYVKYASESSCEVWSIINVDPKLAFLPDWLLNFAVGKLLHFLFHYVEKAAQFDNDSEHAERIRNNPQVYGLVKKIVGMQIKRRVSSPAPLEAKLEQQQQHA